MLVLSAPYFTPKLPALVNTWAVVRVISRSRRLKSGNVPNSSLFIDDTFTCARAQRTFTKEAYVRLHWQTRKMFVFLGTMGSCRLEL